MRSSLVLIGVFVSNLASALVLFPPCASNCYYTALTSYGCNSYDTACYCKPPAATEYVSCVKGDCDQLGLQQFIAWGQQECAAVGVTFAASAGSASAVEASNTATATTTGNPRPIPTNLAPLSGFATASSANPTTTALPVLPTPVAHSGGGLSAGAKAGIGVGAALGSVLILGLLLILLFRERRKRDIALSQQQRPPAPLPQPVSYPATSQKPSLSTGVTSATVGSDASGSGVTSSAAWTTHETKIASATEYELKGDEPAPHQHDPEGAHGEPQSTVL